MINLNSKILKQKTIMGDIMNLAQTIKKIVLLSVIVPLAAFFGSSLSALTYTGSSTQYAGGFNPGTGYGGFGGGNCSASKTPIVFIHGNGDEAKNFDYPPYGPYAPLKSAYDELKSRGYNDCELFGITYLTSTQRSLPQNNYMSSSKYYIIKTFINAVLSYTGKSKVDIISHSLGVSTALGTIKYYGIASKVRKFINIAGGIKGLNSCLWMGYANPISPTCGAQNIYSSYTFGLYPSTGVYWYGYNEWTGSYGSKSMRKAPYYNSGITFYTMTAGDNDQIHCSSLVGWVDCDEGALFNSYSNVKSQLDIGAGSTATQMDYDFEDWSIYNMNGGDGDGVGHFLSKNNTGIIMYNMLNTSCTGTGCKGTYPGPAVAK